MSSPKANHFFNLITTALEEKGSLSPAEVYEVCDVNTYADLRLVNRIVREITRLQGRKLISN